MNNTTDALPLGAGGIAWSTSKATLFVFQLLIMLETIFGNLLVVMSVKLEKKLQTPFNYYIVNLAITDMNVGMSVMSLFAIYNLFGYFPFNNIICGYWVWSDYTMTFESVFTLMTISIDRFWSVTWSTHYRNTYSPKKCLLLLCITWCVVNAIWLPAFIYDRVANDYAPGDCYWDPLRNRYLVIYVGFLGYYMPFLTMIGAYSRILYVMRKRARKIRDSKKVQVATVDGEVDEKKAVVVADDKEEQRRKREQKAVMTLLSIIGVFAVCWVPFYLLFVISAFYPDFFPGWFVEFSYWMAYINSAVNPVLYGISSAEFRAAYIKVFYIITCRQPPAS